MSELVARRTLLAAVDKLVRKPSTMGVQDMANIFFSLSAILSESFGEPVQVTTVYSGRRPVIPTHFSELSEAEIEQERLQFVEFLQLQNHVLNVGYCPTKKQFVLKEDQAAWDAWIYRAKLQKSAPSELQSKHFDGTLCPTDIRIDTFHVPIGRTQFLGRPDIGVIMTHLPTGTRVESKSERTQSKNRIRAFELLEERLSQLSTASQTHSKETLDHFNAYFLTTPSGKCVHKTVMRFWHPEEQRFLIGDIQNAFEEWLKENN